MNMDNVKVIPLGGAGEIGKNCTVVTQGDDMVMIDCGLSFPHEEMHGVDIVIPDFSYVVEHKKKLKGIFLTHAHEDHVGALSFLITKVKAPVYGSHFTIEMLKAKLSEKIDISKVDFRVFDSGEKIKAGELTIEPIRITHSIPGNNALAVKTKYGIVLFTGDFKFDFTPVDGKLTDLNRLSELASEGVVCLLSDSTNVEREGWSHSEKSVAEGLKKVFTEALGRILITTFASNIHRMQQAFDMAEATGRKVAIAGRRMEQSVDTCIKLGYMKVSKDTHIRLNELSKYEPHELIILTTGSQGEPLSALVQMSKDEYSRLKINEGDTVLYSARPIPGNESAIWRTVNRLFKFGANVIYDSPTPIHVSGHGHQEELKMMINLVRPFYLAPIHGEPRHQHLYCNIARNMGYPEHRIFTLSNGTPLVITESNATIDLPVSSGEVLVDSSGKLGVSNFVLKDRAALAKDGVISINLAYDTKKNCFVGGIEISSKGFSGNSQLLKQFASVLEDYITTHKDLKSKQNHDKQAMINDFSSQWLYKKNRYKPVVITSVMHLS